MFNVSHEGLEMITIEIMRSMWPHGDAIVPGLLDGIVASAVTVFPKYGLTSDLVVAHAMAQFSHECGAGTEVVENLDYSAQGLMNTWPTRFDAAKAASFAHHPDRIANEVYNGRMGNLANSNDGWTYRGRGASQVTGRDGYSNLGMETKLNLVDNPDLVNTPQNFLECGVADFVLCHCLPFAFSDDVNGVTFHLNGGFIGLAQRVAWLARWKAVLNAKSNQGHDKIWVQQSLNSLGAIPQLVVDGSFGPATAAAVAAFQKAHNLSVDGQVGPETIGAIEKALSA
jgi:putative chitinase